MDTYELNRRVLASLIEEYEMIIDKNSSRARFTKKKIDAVQTRLKEFEAAVSRTSKPTGNYNGM